MTNHVELRDVRESDLSVFFEQQRDPTANFMAAFTTQNPEDRDGYMARSTRYLADGTNVWRTIVSDGQIAGSVVCYVDEEGRPEVSYWLGGEFWGKGIATAALRAFLGVVTTRPLYARAAKDNRGSLRVLQKCGFVITGEGSGFANARGAETEEFILTLGA